MSTANQKAIDTLNSLIEIDKDAQKGFAEAAENVKDAELRLLFLQYSNERAQFVAELQSEVSALGGKPAATGSAAGAMHRGWIDLKAALTGHDDHAVLVECERGEDAAKEAYQEAAEGLSLPGTALPLVQRQYQKVQQAHDRIRDLRDRVGIPVRN